MILIPKNKHPIKPKCETRHYKTPRKKKTQAEHTLT